MEKKPRGTAQMSPENRKRVAQLGGLKVSENRKHMAEIGRKGGLSISEDRDHMSEIGKKGGSTPRKKKNDAGA